MKINAQYIFYCRIKVLPLLYHSNGTLILKTRNMSLTKNFYHDEICEQQNPEYDQYNYDVLAEQEYFAQLSVQNKEIRNLTFEEKLIRDEKNLGLRLF